MSLEQSPPTGDEQLEIPQDIQDLQKAIADFAAFRTLVQYGTFTGAQSKNVVKLVEFLSDSYRQVLKQFEEHPWVIDQKAKHAQQL